MTYYLVTYRLDYLALGLLAVAALWLSTRFVHARRGPNTRIPGVVYIAAALLVISGGLLAEYAENRQKRALEGVFAGFGPTYAYELALAGHAEISTRTAPDDPVYLRLLEMQKMWLRLNPLISDVYTIRRDADGRIRFIVDSETDYNHDGRYDGEIEMRTPIGEVYEEATEAFFTAAAGKATFDRDIVPDRWGVSVTSLTPILDDKGQVEAVVGLDYPADDWLAAIAIRRALVLTPVGILVGLLLSSAALITLMTGEIQQRRAAQRQLQHAKDAADRASRAKGEFLAIMSHEIRTPLTAITGYASMLEETPLDADQQRYVRTLRRGATNLIDLLNNILDFSRIEEGKLQLETIPCTPADVVRDVIDLMSAAAAEKNLRLLWRDQLPRDLCAMADPARLRQILMNLVGNAVKFTSKGSVAVTSTWAANARDPGKGVLEIVVEDTGPGIPPDKLETLFQMFAQADAAVARKHGGSGLGLAISRRLAEMMDGEIHVQSTVDVGTVFSVRIPCSRLESPPTPEPPPVDEPAPAAPGRYLIVDDNPLNCEVLKAMLARTGCTIDVANTGTKAVALVASTRYDAVLMDLAMPEMDGAEAAARIRSTETAVRTPIIAVTASASTADRDACMGAGMDDFLVKPVDRERLLAALERVRARHSTTGERSAT